MGKSVKLDVGKAISHLKKDRILKPVIENFEPLKWEKPSENLFESIVSNIIGQQLSGGPAEVIEKRFRNLFSGEGFPTPQQVLAKPDSVYRECGMSWSKAKYIKNLAQAIRNGELDLKSLGDLSDEEVIIQLTKIKGIGRWTAEMILIFHLQRPDVFSLGDLGLRTAVARLYKVDRDNRKKIAKIARSWSPFRTVASRYLWHYLDT
jgi:DNA-3-methyladenine glycosylase II